MPYLKLQTNITVENKKQWMEGATSLLSDMLGKSQNYIMIAVEDGADMLFAGSDTPLAFMELKSIGLPESRAAAFSEKLCEHIRETLGIPPDRVYIEFTDVNRAMFGWKGKTFG